MSDTDSLTLSRDEIPMPNTAEGILSVMRNILNKPYVQSVLLSQGNPIQVSWYRDISDSLQIKEPEESIDSVLSRIDLGEITGSTTFKELLLDGLIKVSVGGRIPSHLLVGNIETFKQLLNLPSIVNFSLFDGTDNYNFAGLPLVEVPGLQDDSVVLLTADVRGAVLTEAKGGLKISA